MRTYTAILAILIVAGLSGAPCHAASEAEVKRQLAGCFKSGTRGICFAELEAAAFTAPEVRATRRKGALRVTTSNGVISFVDSEFVQHRYIGFIDEMGHHVVLRFLREGWRYVLVSNATGSQVVTTGLPQLSPSQQRAFTLSASIFIGPPPEIAIWKVSPEGFESEFRSKLDGVRVADASWVDENSVQLRTQYLKDGSPTEENEMIHFAAGGWIRSGSAARYFVQCSDALEMKSFQSLRDNLILRNSDLCFRLNDREFLAARFRVRHPAGGLYYFREVNGVLEHTQVDGRVMQGLEVAEEFFGPNNKRYVLMRWDGYPLDMADGRKSVENQGYLVLYLVPSANGRVFGVQYLATTDDEDEPCEGDDVKVIDMLGHRIVEQYSEALRIEIDVEGLDCANQSKILQRRFHLRASGSVNETPFTADTDSRPEGN